MKKIVERKAKLNEGVVIDGIKLKQPILNVLHNRGYETEEDIKKFFSLTHKRHLLKDALPDEEKAFDLIDEAIEKDWKVVNISDYDVDGVSSSSIVMSVGQELELDIHHFTSHRFNEGYGLNDDSLKRFLELHSDADLVITTDCGITSVDQVKKLKELGIRVIITDHHEPLEILPEADALINPKLKGSSYPFNELCGAGVVFKLFLNYAKKRSDDPLLEEFVEGLIDYVALATIADIVPLVSENRILVKEGLKQMNSKPKPYILSYIKEKKGSGIDAQGIAFGVGPMFNALSRIYGHMDDGLELLLSGSLDEANPFLRKALDANEHRKSIVETAVCNIPESGDKPVIIVDNSLSHGVVGIIASKVVDALNIPCIVLGENSAGNLTGSARSIDGVSMISFLDSCKDILIKYGGHEGAAGLTIAKENLNEFRRRFEDVKMPERIESDEIAVDYILDGSNLENLMDILMQMSYLEPFGKGFEPPIFAVENFDYIDMTYMGKTKKCAKFIGEGMEVVTFDRKNQEFPTMGTLTAVGQLGINNYNGKSTFQFLIRDYLEV